MIFEQKIAATQKLTKASVLEWYKKKKTNKSSMQLFSNYISWGTKTIPCMETLSITLHTML